MTGSPIPGHVLASTPRSGALRQVILHRPGLELQAADPRQQGPAAVRRRAVGAPRPGGARPLRRRAARARRHRAPVRRPAAAHRRGARGAGARPRPDLRRARLRADGHRRAAQLLRRDGPRHAHRAPRRRDHQARGARPHPRAALDRPSTCSPPTTSCWSRCPTTSTPATRRPGSTAAWRSTACARRRGSARPRNYEADLPLAPAVRRRGLRDLVGGLGERARDHRRRRHARPRRRCAC